MNFKTNLKEIGTLIHSALILYSVRRNALIKKRQQCVDEIYYLSSSVLYSELFVLKQVQSPTEK